MKVSLITITYNSAETLEATITSVINQSYKDIEYIIIDGKSTDTTLDIISKYKDAISYFVSEKDKGLYDALNKGIAAATGDVVGIIHSDDFYTNDNVIEHIVTIFKQQHCDGIYADLYYIDREDTSKIVRKWTSGKYTEGAFLNGWMPPHPTFFVKKNCYDRFGNFNLQLKSAADYELMLRFIHKQKIKLAYLPEFIVKMRVGGKSNVTLKNRLRANAEDKQAWILNGLRPKWYTLYLKPLRKVFQFLVK